MDVCGNVEIVLDLGGLFFLTSNYSFIAVSVGGQPLFLKSQLLLSASVAAGSMKNCTKCSKNVKFVETRGS